jgi:biotin carboxyl carrier protein
LDANRCPRASARATAVATEQIADFAGDGGRRRSTAALRNDLAVSANSELTVTAPFAGVVVSVAHAADERVSAGAPLVVLEAMKMEHEVLAEAGGVVRSVEVTTGEAVEEGQVLLVLSTLDAESGKRGRADGADGATAAPLDGGGMRADLEAVRARHLVGLDT